jgi:hypothetical protein
MQGTPTGLPWGIPGMGEEMEGSAVSGTPCAPLRLGGTLPTGKASYRKKHHTRVLPQQLGWSKGESIDKSTIGT